MNIANLDSLKDHYNKYIYPKPVQNIESQIIKNKKIPNADPNFNWHRLWPEKKYSTKKLSVLVAGCGSDQAAILAKCNPNHDFIGVDLSEKSINYQNKLIKKHKIKNLILHCSDFRLLKFNNKFDYIISTGVIHHLEDPGSALKFFNNNIKNNGVIYLMVYGNQNSYSINQIKKVFKSLNLNQDKESIIIAKNLINKLHNKHPAKIFSNNFNDFEYDSGIVDFLLHKSEIFFSIKNLVSLLSDNDLIIKNFYNGKIASVTKYFLDDEDVLNKIRSLPVENRWELGQILNWDDRKIQIVCCKKNNVKYSLAYNPISFDNIYTYINRSLNYNLSKKSITIIDPSNKQTMSFNVEKYNNDINWKILLEGKRKLSDILNNFDDALKLNIRKIINVMIENYLIDVSLNPIADYYNYYNK